MKYYLIAGEASGDLHGANLMKALKEKDALASFWYFGGDLMVSQGGTLAKHISGLAFMGFAEVISNLTTIFKNLQLAKNDILQYQPDALILIDFPGFNLKIAEFAKKNGIRVFYYISPKVWAWNQKRVLKIKKIVDKMFCILPFEVEFYKSWGMKVDYIGNPLLDAISAHQPDPLFRINRALSGKPLVSLLPGSRKQEISRILPDMISVARSFPSFQFVIAGAPNFDRSYYQNFIGKNEIPVLFNSTYDLLLNSQAAIVASGTATLETALFHVPQVVVYKGNRISIFIARMLIKVRFISLVNLIMDKEVVKELIQEKADSISMAAELHKILYDLSYRETMELAYEQLADKMGKPGASARAAGLMVSYLINE